jgi:hypothetical protein
MIDQCQSCNYPLLQEEEHFDLGCGETGPLCNDCEES